VAGQNGSSQYLVLTLSTNAVFNDNGGHFYESGTPQAGHENDFVIESESDLARCAAPTPTPTFTPTNTPTDTPTSTNTPTSTSITDPYDLAFFCMGFRIISLNNFASSYAWSINGGPSGTGSLPAFGYVDIYTEYNPGLVTLYAGEQLMKAGFLPTNCDEDEATPTPPAITPRTPPTTRTPRSNPTEVVKTLIPQTSSTSEILIPVTGVDLGSGSSSTQQTLLNLGLFFLGIGFITNGFSRKKANL
jgi:hypothetical protein